MRKHPAKREILWQRARSPYLQEMHKEIKGATVRRDHYHSHSQVLSYHNLSRDNRKMLEKYSRSTNKRIRSEALVVLSAFTRYPPPGGIERAEEDIPDEEMSDGVLE